MSGVRIIKVEAGEDGLRIDRWFRNRYPKLTQGKLQKLLRTGQIRLDGARAKAGDRVAPGQEVRVPPNVEEGPRTRRPNSAAFDAEAIGKLADDLKQRILYQDDNVLVLDKPAGLAVQGGSKTREHVDGALDRLKFGADERPRLVHRLDRDTSGVLLLARTRLAAAELGRIFQRRETRKVYWALVIGRPEQDDGFIDAPLLKSAGKRGDTVRVDLDNGKSAKTRFRTIDHAGKSASWLELEPLTGRTHQLRVHCQAIGNPIFGDGKYGRRDDMDVTIADLPNRLHLHARALQWTDSKGKQYEIVAPLPPHMKETWQHLGLDENDEQAQLIEP